MSKGTRGFAGHVVTVIVFVAATVIWAGYILMNSGVLPTPGDSYEIQTVVPTASQLTPGARVTMAGVDVGRVTGVSRADAVGPGARLALELTDERVVPLPVDSRVSVRTRSQVGENYVSIQVGKAGEKVPGGGTLPVAQADDLVAVDEILSILRGKTRARTRTLLSDFGGALSGRGPQLNRTIRGANGTVEHGARLVDVLHRDRGSVAKLVDQVGRVMAAVGERGDAIDTIGSSGLTSLRAIASRDAALAATLGELPNTLERVRTASVTVGAVSGRSAPVVRDLATATRQLRPAVDALAPTAKDAVAVVDDLDRAVPPLGRALTDITLLDQRLPQQLPKVRRVFCELNPALRYLSPYKDDLLQIAHHLGSASNSYDAIGHLVRLTPVINENSLAGAPPAVLSASQTLLSSGALLGQKVLSYDPFMKPGQVGKSGAKRGQPANQAELKASGYKYPRITADC